jgi:hypothetical protein
VRQNQRARNFIGEPGACVQCSGLSFAIEDLAPLLTKQIGVAGVARAVRRFCAL